MPDRMLPHPQLALFWIDVLQVISCLGLGREPTRKTSVFRHRQIAILSSRIETVVEDCELANWKKYLTGGVHSKLPLY